MDGVDWCNVGDRFCLDEKIQENKDVINSLQWNKKKIPPIFLFIHSLVFFFFFFASSPTIAYMSPPPSPQIFVCSRVTRFPPPDQPLSSYPTPARGKKLFLQPPYRKPALCTSSLQNVLCADEDEESIGLISFDLFRSTASPPPPLPLSDSVKLPFEIQRKKRGKNFHKHFCRFFFRFF